VPEEIREGAGRKREEERGKGRKKGEEEKKMGPSGRPLGPPEEQAPAAVRDLLVSVPHRSLLLSKTLPSRAVEKKGAACSEARTAA
jgi:hypothetical protein